MANQSAREELRRLIQQHVDPQHRDHAIKLLDAITASAGGQGAGGPGGGRGQLFSQGGRGNGGGGVPHMGWGGGGGQQFAWGGGAGFAGGGGGGPAWAGNGFAGGWGIGPGAIGAGAGGGPSALDGDVDQAMLNLALDGPAPFAGVTWNANPVPSFDLVDSSGADAVPPQGQSRLGVAFQIPASDQQSQTANATGSKSSDPTPAGAAGASSSSQPAAAAPAAAPAPAPAPAQPPAPQHPAKFSSVVGGTAQVARGPGGVAPPAATADQQLQQRKQQQAALDAQRREEAKQAEARRIEASRTTGVGKGVDPKSNNPKVKLRGLPYGSTVADVLNFFRGFGVIDNSVTFGVNSEGRPSGEAWVSFIRLDDARRAVREKDRHHMGDRYVELFLLSEGGGVAGR